MHIKQQFQKVKITETDKWDSIVKSFKHYDVAYLSNYVKAFELNGDGEPILFYFENNDTRAMNVIMKRDVADSDDFKEKIPKNEYFDLTTPYGYGGFIKEGDNIDEINTAYNLFCREEKIVAEFVRFNLFTDSHYWYEGIVESNIRNVVRDLEIPIEEIFMDFEHRVRKSIKKATKAGLRVEFDYTGERLEDFLRIYYGTMERSNARDTFYFQNKFFQSINNLNDNYVYIHVLYEDKVISTELVLYGKENCYSFLGGTDKEYFHLNSNNFLKYEIIKWAKEFNLKRFVLGGGYGADDGIFNYKKGFSPRGILNFYTGKKIYNNEKYKKLLEIKEKDSSFNNTSNFFPLYRS